MGILFLGTLMYLVYKFLFKPVIKGYKELNKTAQNNENLKKDFKDLGVIEKINFCHEIYDNIVQPREAREKLIKKEKLEELINKVK